MQTPLNESTKWFLEAVFYEDRDLRIFVVEGFVGGATQDIHVGQGVIRDVRAVEPNERSRRFEIRFENAVAWQVVSGSFFSPDPYELLDEPAPVQIIARSRYLDYVQGSHGWYEQVIGPGNHYRISTLDDVIDVVACRPPTIEPRTR